MLEQIRERWPEILNHLKQEYDISDVSFNTWLLPLTVEAVENDTIIVVVPEESVGLQIIKKKYYLPLKVSVEEVLGSPYEIEFILPNQLKETTEAISKEAHSEQMDVFEKAGLNPKYTFSNFVVGESNNLAHAAAIAHFILEHNPSMRVLYVTSETFTNEIIDAIRGRNDNPLANTLFREKYRNVDVLLIDDIQFISGKESTQQEFFHTFNALYESKKQIIISSDKPPKEIDNLEERLCSRFLWGLPVDIQSPNYETRVAILKKKIELEQVSGIDDAVINYIATNVNSNIRELEGALTKIIAYSKLTSTEITLKFAEDVLSDLFNEAQKEVTPDMIIKIVAEHFNISVSDITSKKKSQDIVYPRQLIMYLCRTLTDVALSVIGKKIGNRDHTTVIHGYEKIQKEMEKNEKVKKDLEILKKKIIPA